MEILYLLIPVSLVIAALAVGIFFWAVKSGQYDDLEGPAWRILFDDEPRVWHPDECPTRARPWEHPAARSAAIDFGPGGLLMAFGPDGLARFDRADGKQPHVRLPLGFRRENLQRFRREPRRDDRLHKPPRLGKKLGALFRA